MKLTGRAPQHLSTLNGIREYFTHLLITRLHLDNIKVDEFYLLSNKPCHAYDNINLNSSFTFLLHMTFLIKEHVHRARTESMLNGLDNEMHNMNIDQQLISLKAEPNVEAFIAPALIKMSSCQETCFIQHIEEKDAYKNVYQPKENFRSVPVSQLLLCDQLEFNEDEYGVKRVQMAVTLYVINKLLKYNQYHLMPRGMLRVCIDDLKELTDISSSILNPLHDALEIVTIACTSLSLLCLILTFGAYCLCPELRTVPGCNNMFLIGSLFITQATFQFGNISLQNAISCPIIGVVTHVAWLSLFCWMNVCSFHMFRTFAFLRVVDNSDAYKYKTLRRYSLYAFGTPICIVSCNAIVSGNQMDWKYLGYGRVKCFIDDLIPFVVTFLAPVILICVFNLVFFCITALKIKQTPNVQSSQDKRHFDIYIKLFVITGGAWILVIVESFLPFSALSFVTTVMNACQGVFLFVSCVGNERNWKLIRSNTSKLLARTSATGSKSRSASSTKHGMLKDEPPVTQLKEN